MIENKELKERVYLMLYTHPLYEAVKDINEKKEVNILIDIDDAEIVDIVLRAVIWCGYFPNVNLNIFIAKELSQSIPKGCEKYVKIFKKENTSEFDYVVTNDHNKEGININDVDNRSREDLKRIAKNIYFVYELEKDQRKNIKDISFNNDEKGYFSSLAAAVHMRYKMYLAYLSLKEISDSELIKKEKRGEEKEDLYLFAFNRVVEKADLNKDKYVSILNNIISFEHNRWVLYTLCDDICNYQKPSISQIRENLYIGNNLSHKFSVDDIKYHACLCDCDANGIVLTKDKTFWDLDETKINFKLDKGEISELNWLSLLCRIREREFIIKEEQKYIEILTELLSICEQEGLTKEKYDLEYSFQEMLEGTDGAKVLFDKVFNSLKNSNPSVKEKIDKILKRDRNELYLSILFKFNEKEDFFIYDERIVRSIPFCINYQKDKLAVITLGDKLEDDVIVPTIVMPEESVFLITSKQEQYKERLLEYYKFRKMDTGSITIVKKSTTNSEDSLNSIENVLTKLKEKGYEKIIVNATSSTNRFLISIGELVHNYPEVTILFYDRTKGKGLGRIENYFGGESAYKQYPQKNFSMFEYLNLIGENIRTELKNSKNIKINKKVLELLSTCFFQKFNNGKKHTSISTEDSNILRELNGFINGKEGFAFEAIVYGRLYYSNLFDEIQSGFELNWEDRKNSKNEFDTVAIKGYNRIFVSCKSKSFDKDEWKNPALHEVVYWMHKYNCHGVIAVPYKRMKNDKLERRAKDSNVLLLTQEDLINQEKFNEKISIWLGNNYNVIFS